MGCQSGDDLQEKIGSRAGTKWHLWCKLDGGGFGLGREMSSEANKVGTEQSIREAGSRGVTEFWVNCNL